MLEEIELKENGREKCCDVDGSKGGMGRVFFFLKTN
jgi:hypothetical protein